MGSMEHTDSRGTYSWWWDGHIVPQHSKWLQQSLADMDDTILEMLNLIKEDGDSFAMRAQMFYQRKPKLAELIEQIYKAYRALAERYDHASGALRQVRDSVSEASDASNLTDADSTELDVDNFINKISNLQESVSQSEIEIENLKQCLGRAETERDDAVEKCKVAESEVESLRVAVAETREEKVDVEAAFKKLQTVHLNSAKQFRVCNSDISVRSRVLDDLDDKTKNSKEVGSSSLQLKDQNLRLRDIAKNLEADMEFQVKYQKSLHQEIVRLKMEADEAKEKLRVVEQSQQSLVSEKAWLVSRLETADSKIEAFRNRLKGFESSWNILLHDKLSLIAEKEALEGRCKELENGRDDLLSKKTQFQLVSDMENQILQLKNAVLVLEDENSGLSSERSKLVEVCGSFERRLSDLENEILKRELELESITGELQGIIDQNLESAIERSVIYSVVAQMGEEQSESNQRLESEVRKIVAGREEAVASLVQNMVVGSIRESLLEEQVNELIEGYRHSRETNAREIKLLYERISLLEGQNVRLSSVLASSYLTAEEASTIGCHEFDSLEIKDIKQVLGEELVITGLTPNSSSSSSSTQGPKHRPHNHPHEITTHVVVSGRESADDGIHEFWETNSGSSTIDLKVGIRSRNHRRVADCIFSMDSPSPELPAWKKKLQEASRRMMTLDRLGTDTQKLANLKITLQDLKRKVDSTDTDEYDNIREQLEAVEADIVTLFDTNQKLTKSMQTTVNKSSDCESSDLTGSGFSGELVRRVSEQAWRVGEEIGRQQRKLQSVQWILVKMDEEKKIKGRRRRSSNNGNAGGGNNNFRVINFSEGQGKKVLLKDVLHVRVKKHLKKNLKKKKEEFCSCVNLQ